ncbi:MAG: hypothetical protein JRN26_05530 [Nitrososphaerota archaeon]|jgi:hypothetical protein|nr:hypothetical protein [Nitrososphaerota archaeon]MDG6927186.1 hypothetical protein [Nitrososphaerota archaeon]MDG6930826.1 hypothetical protein [Nitrososphaerota archaeon]MDG6932270.1 hypothetical protein [Nitrososphaerota archaeon]MDG6936325.1 hypothetical protein [Nitrososphaerota archaeon]
MTNIESLPWRPLKAKNDAYRRAEVVDHNYVPFEIACMFYNEPTQLIKNTWYYYQRISGDLIRNPFPLDWRQNAGFPSEEFMLSAAIQYKPQACELCGHEFTLERGGYHVNIHVVSGRIHGYLCDLCDEAYMQTLAHYTSKTYPRLADRVLRLVEVAQI